MHDIIPVLWNIRSAHNVGAIMRTANGCGLGEIITCGYTPHPLLPQDTRLPHIAAGAAKQIAKTALGAETTLRIHHYDSIEDAVDHLRSRGYRIVALEQAPTATPLGSFTPGAPFALLLGEERHGIPESILRLCDETVELEMKGSKESFNVSVAAGIALYYCAMLQ